MRMDNRGVPARCSSPHLIGRRDELEQLGDAFESAAAGSPAVVLLAGDSGVGKSRLTAELLDRLRQTGAVSMTGDCVQLSEGEIPFAPIASGLRRLAKDLDEDTCKAVLGSPTGELAGLFPEL